MSSLKDLASLIMIPSLVKDGRLDTVKPLGNSIIHPDATGNNDAHNVGDILDLHGWKNLCRHVNFMFVCRIPM